MLNKILRVILLKVYPGFMHFPQDLKVKKHNFKIIFLSLNNNNSTKKTLPPNDMLGKNTTMLQLNLLCCWNILNLLHMPQVSDDSVHLAVILIYLSRFLSSPFLLPFFFTCTFLLSPFYLFILVAHLRL